MRRYIFFDISSSFFLSYTYSTFLLSFFGLTSAFINEWVILNALLVYLILVGVLIFGLLSFDKSVANNFFVGL
ncbi:hypothetical protein LCGC14_1444960 [marine sediment metagenome]|uniref:Uncharacterized protein n=1 Tax=marine sediment metagenome TaxID=412755 RepID=A0A0F9JJH7_9ZZZZ